MFLWKKIFLLFLIIFAKLIPGFTSLFSKYLLFLGGRGGLKWRFSK
jgi:hypothetical protein